MVVMPVLAPGDMAPSVELDVIGSGWSATAYLTADEAHELSRALGEALLG